MSRILFWVIMIFCLLIIFEIPQKIYHNIKNLNIRIKEDKSNGNSGNDNNRNSY